MEDVSADILAAVGQPTAPWLPELTEKLVRRGWRALEKELGIFPATYSTTRVLRRRKEIGIGLESLVPVFSSVNNFSCFIEYLPPEARTRFQSDQYQFPDSAEISGGNQVQILRDALEEISYVPSLYESVKKLVQCVHILRTRNQETDISFSEPDLTFSIFISIPTVDSPNAPLRVAEAVIHESMHLQLSLLENILPFTLSNTPQFYSPWKQSDRNASGVLHALYVFTVIDHWLALLPSDAIVYADQRRGEIANQVGEVLEFKRARLTSVGEALREYLFSRF